MKLLICSDIHGDSECAKKVLFEFDRHKADKLIILGDILYHGPRNDLPNHYNPKEVITLLNERREAILSVRGNCDTEVDAMVLSFPILADYAYVSDGTVSMLLTHGHKFNPDSPPPLRSGEILLNGHTHIPAFEEFGNNNVYINPGSISIPKANSKPSYILYENGTFTLYSTDGERLKAFALNK